MRGEIRAFTDEAGGRRPPLLVVQSDALSHAPTVVGLVVTSRPQRAGEPLTVAVEADEAGLDQASWIKITQVHTVPVSRARELLGIVPAELMARVDAALVAVLGLDLSGGGSGRRSGPRDPSATRR